MNCEICGVKTAHDWANGICFHCDWHLGEGYTVEDIKKLIENGKVECDE